MKIGKLQTAKELDDEGVDFSALEVISVTSKIEFDGKTIPRKVAVGIQHDHGFFIACEETSLFFRVSMADLTVLAISSGILGADQPIPSNSAKVDWSVKGAT